MKVGRYSQSPSASTFLRTSNNKLTPRNAYSPAPKNPQQNLELQKLPSLTPTPLMRRSASLFTTQRNTRSQLSVITQKLQDLQAEIHNARMDANETLNHMRFMKHDLIQNKLGRDTEDLKNQIAGLKKLVHITKTSHENRSNQLRQNYIKLWNQTQDLRQMVFDIRMKMDKIEETMGIKYE